MAHCYPLRHILKPLAPPLRGERKNGEHQNGERKNETPIFVPKLLLSPNFFLDMSGCVAKMSISALREFNADMFIFIIPNLHLSHSDGKANREPRLDPLLRQAICPPAAFGGVEYAG